MNYCENCKSACGSDHCPVCGNRRLREVKSDDFCFLVELSAMYGKMLEEMLTRENIPCAAVPRGNGVRTIFGLDLENYGIYVPYEFRERSAELAAAFSAAPPDELLRNLDKLNIEPRIEKKLRRKLKLTEEDDFIGFCRNKILHAKKIADEGRITDCVEGGRYLFVYTDNEVLVINSATYEILSVKKLK